MTVLRDPKIVMIRPVRHRDTLNLPHFTKQRKIPINGAQAEVRCTGDGAPIDFLGGRVIGTLANDLCNQTPLRCITPCRLFHKLPRPFAEYLILLYINFFTCQAIENNS